MMSEFYIELTLSHYNKSIKGYVDEITYNELNKKFNSLPGYIEKLEIPEIGYTGILLENHFAGDVWFIHRQKVIRKIDNIIEIRFDKNKFFEETLINFFDRNDIPDSFFLLENRKYKTYYRRKCSER